MAPCPHHYVGAWDALLVSLPIVYPRPLFLIKIW